MHRAGRILYGHTHRPRMATDAAIVALEAPKDGSLWPAVFSALHCLKRCSVKENPGVESTFSDIVGMKDADCEAGTAEAALWMGKALVRVVCNHDMAATEHVTETVRKECGVRPEDRVVPDTSPTPVQARIKRMRKRNLPDGEDGCQTKNTQTDHAHRTGNAGKERKVDDGQGDKQDDQAGKEQDDEQDYEQGDGQDEKVNKDGGKDMEELTDRGKTQKDQATPAEVARVSIGDSGQLASGVRTTTSSCPFSLFSICTIGMHAQVPTRLLVCRRNTGVVWAGNLLPRGHTHGPELDMQLRCCNRRWLRSSSQGCVPVHCHGGEHRCKNRACTTRGLEESVGHDAGDLRRRRKPEEGR